MDVGSVFEDFPAVCWVSGRVEGGRSGEVDITCFDLTAFDNDRLAIRLDCLFGNCSFDFLRVDDELSDGVRLGSLNSFSFHGRCGDLLDDGPGLAGDAWTGKAGTAAAGVVGNGWDGLVFGEHPGAADDASAVLVFESRGAVRLRFSGGSGRVNLCRV